MASNELVRQRMINKANRSLREYYNMENGFLPVPYRTAEKCKHSWVKPACLGFGGRLVPKLKGYQQLCCFWNTPILHTIMYYRCTVLFKSNFTLPYEKWHLFKYKSLGETIIEVSQNSPIFNF